MDGDLDWRRQEKTLLGAALIVGPLLMFAGSLFTLGVYDGDDFERYLASVAEHETAYYVGSLVTALGAVFMVGAVVALIHLVRVRRPRYAVVAGAIALLAVITMSGAFMVFTILDYEMANDPNREAIVAFNERVEDSAAVAPLFITWIGSALGLLLLAIGLLWARTVPRWTAAVLLGASVFIAVAQGDVLGVVAGGLLVVGFAAIGVMVLRASVAAWEAGDLSRREEERAAAPAPGERAIA